MILHPLVLDLAASSGKLVVGCAVLQPVTIIMINMLCRIGTYSLEFISKKKRIVLVKIQ